MKNHLLGLGATVLFAGLACFLAWDIHRTDLAHATFERYYAFRGCAELLERTDTYGYCKLVSGETIKLVLYEGRWYLDGDLPTRWSLTF